MERSARGIFGSLGRWKCLFGKQQGQQRSLPPQSGTTGGRRSLRPCNGCTEGTLTIRNRGFGPCTSPGTGSLQSHRDLLLTKQSSFGGAHKAIRAGADLHMQEQGT